MRRLRIAVFHNLHSGGAKRVTAEHLARLSAHHEVALYSLRSADHAFAANGAKASYETRLYDYTPRPWLRSPFGRLNTLVGADNLRRMDALCRQIAADIDAAKFDVVLAHPCQVTNAPAVLRWLKTPSLYYCHELPRRFYEPAIPRPYEPDQSKRSGLRRALDKLDITIAYKDNLSRQLDRESARAATCIASNSDYTRHNAEPVYGREIQTCHLGVDAEAFAPAQHTGPRQRVVLSVGSLTPAKGFDFVVQALATLPRGTDGCRPPLVVISNFQEGPERDYVSALAKDNDVPLQLLTRVSDDELRGWYARAACVAYAPVREPFGLVALEAMAASAPLVAVAEGGVAESVVDGVTGIIAPREPQPFGKAIGKLLDDPVRAQHLGQQAREHVSQHWTWGQHINKLEAMLDKTAAGKTQNE